MVLKAEKEAIIKDLKKTRDGLNVAIKESADFKSELIIEKSKVSKLLVQISKMDANLNTILNCRREIDRLNRVVTALKQDKLQLIKSNQEYKSQRDSTIFMLGNVIRFGDTLLKTNISLKKEIKKEAVILVNNFKVYPINVSKKGNVLHTVNANKVNYLRINFVVSGSKAATPCLKKYFIQIIDFEGNVFGDKLAAKFGNSILFYSAAPTEINFVDKNVEVEQFIPGTGLRKGTYFVNVYDEDLLVSKASFTLI